MEDDFFTTLGQVGVQIGIRLFGTSVEPNREIDRTALADAVLESSVHQASLIVRHFGIVRQLEPGDFGFIVGVIATEQTSLIEYLTNMKLSILRDCSRNIDATCGQALMALRT